MPITTPLQKIDQVNYFGKKSIEIILTGNTYDGAQQAAMAHSIESNIEFINPFDDLKVIEGPATVGM
ncbi:MAG: hypothetical protein A2W91_08615 [Bacteroidetes bacterium GWF2_38_335]|nr:MAG: hypothetical protein A2W91_08615 [Bacteroidetes bacterium GWF2_38_335]OFY80440.1 MAG: hypothetical protein A2281_08340 [Bacteroidetes bacterium RIFOXYA12_FULL_38_20]